VWVADITRRTCTPTLLRLTEPRAGVAFSRAVCPVVRHGRVHIIRETRALEARKQTVDIRIEEQAGEVLLERNEIEAKTKIEDRRKSAP
jgi:hypothetical protein